VEEELIPKFYMVQKEPGAMPYQNENAAADVQSRGFEST
jgi:hypothetical protein